jgi:hypothetical protein
MREAAGMLSECGPRYRVDARTLKRWAVKHGVPVWKAGRDDMASWTDLLEVHNIETDRRERQARRRA